MNSKNRHLLIDLLAFEFVLLNLVLFLSLYVLVPEFTLSDEVFRNKILVLTVIYNLSWLLIVLYIRNNSFYFNPDRGQFKSLLVSLFFFVGIVTTVVIILEIKALVSPTFIVPIFIFTLINLIAHRILMRYLKSRSTNTSINSLVIISSKELGNLQELTEVMRKSGYEVMGYLRDGDEVPEKTTDYQIQGRIKKIKKVLKKHPIDELFIALSELDPQLVRTTIDLADNYGVRVKLIPNIPLFVTRNYQAQSLMGELTVFKLRQTPLDNFNKTIIKRLFDFCFALFVIVVFSPIFLLIGIFIYLSSGGPVFYTPHRKGEGGETFKCYKFRTMSDSDNPISGTKSTVVNDPRITKLGKFLRKTDLDELPQFFNVLKGEMSVIGPRPHRINLQKDFRKSVNNYMVRSYVKPGITGWAQVNGWRGPTTTDEQKNERVKHDLWYIENWSFWLDLKIIYLTLFGRHRKNAF
ncbi:MAG: exopolysaccharide biosynthesis polyprenyl glycosylphosphotransferase [Flavobacteriaceae bacterium]